MGFRTGHRQFLAARNAALPYFGRADVNDISWGTRYVKGAATREHAIRFNVNAKKPGTRLTAREMIPQRINGIPTDVTAFRFRPHTRNEIPYSLVRPLLGGVQVQGELLNGPVDWGTAGCVVGYGQLHYAITCHHVLFGIDGTEAGMQVFQPKKALFGERIGTAGMLADAKLDYALIPLDAGVGRDRTQSLNGLTGLVHGYRMPWGLDTMGLFKSGAASGVTQGVYDGRSLVYPHLVTIRSENNQPVSLAGDSGSAWVCRDDDGGLRLFGLHRSGDESGKLAMATLYSSIHQSVHAKLRAQLSMK